jgi:hypothetical protein
MEFGIFKGLLALLFFGAVFVFGLWQLAALRRVTPKRDAAEDADGPQR